MALDCISDEIVCLSFMIETQTITRGAKLEVVSVWHCDYSSTFGNIALINTAMSADLISIYAHLRWKHKASLPW